MEPHATIAAWDGDRLTVWTATQGDQRRAATRWRSCSASRRTTSPCSCPFVGGGFGCKGNTWPPATLAAMAARIVGRPVKLVLTRRQMYTSNGYRPRTIQKLRARPRARTASCCRCGMTGSPRCRREALGRVHRAGRAGHRDALRLPERRGHAPARRGQCEPADLHAGARRGERQCSRSNRRWTSWRSRCKIDPIALRLRNYAEQRRARAKAVRQQAAARVLRAGRRGVRLAAPHAAAALDARRPLAGRDGHGDRRPIRPTASRRRRACGCSPTAPRWCESGTQDLGTGTYTVMTQVAAEELGLPVGRVRFELGDSRFPKAPVSGGSQTVASVAPAVQAAARGGAGQGARAGARRSAAAGSGTSIASHARASRTAW